LEDPPHPFREAWARPALRRSCAPVYSARIPLSGPALWMLRERRPDRVVAMVACDGPCLLLLAQPWAPGWKARVDGRPAELLRPNLAALGVMVPPGEHEAELVYELW